MRVRIALLVAVLAASVALLSGCFVFDELDKGQKELERYGKKTKQEEVKKQQAGSEDNAGKPSEPPGQAWWSTARSLAPGSDAQDAEAAQDPNAVVRCQLGGSSRFMRRRDCISQGGRAGSR